jgi:hypothetical protein
VIILKQTSEEVESELKVIKDFILLPMLLTVVDNIRNKEIFIDKVQEMIIDSAVESLMNLIHNDLVEVRKQMRNLKIKVWEEDQNKPYLDYKYIRGGYEERFMLLKTVAKAELSVKLGNYVNELMRRLN